MLLVAPGLLVPAAASGPPALRRFARYAGAPVEDADGLAHLACTVLGVAADAPLGALLAAGAGLAPGPGYWLLADPVTLVAGRHDVLLHGQVEDLARDESAELLTALNAHFHDDGLAFVAARPNLWLARMPNAPPLTTTPLPRALRGPLAHALPGGAAGPQWRRWQDEIQMLLHAHPVNVEREARGKPPANAVWFWGGGRFADARPAVLLDVDAPATRAGDLVRGIAAAARAGGAAAARPRTVVVRAALATGADLQAFVDDALEPALAALERHERDTLTLLADGDGRALAWTAPAPSLRRRWAARIGTRPFAFPPPAAT